MMVLLLTAPASADERSPESLVLVPGAAIERTLEAGGADLFHLELEAGKPWRVRVDQRGIDVVMEVTDPHGQSLLTVDSPLGREGTESLLLTPAVTGLHVVHVRCEKQGVPAGRYEIRLDELPAANAADRQRLRAEEAMADAARFYVANEDGARQQALAKLREAQSVWRTLGEQRQEARTLLVIGGFFDERDERRQAVSSYGEALALWRQLNDQSGVAATLDRLGLTLYFLGENARAVSYLEEALTLRQGLGQRSHEAETRGYLGLVLQKLGRWPAAAECYEKALALARELDYSALEARVLSGLGGIYQNLGEPAKEFEYLQQALNLRRATGAELGEAIALNNLGVFHRRLGEIEEALLNYSRALATFERLENRYWEAYTLNNIGFAFLSLGESDRARAYLLRALPLRRAVDDKVGEVVTLRNLGRAFSGLGEAGKAAAFFRKALEISLAAGDRRGTATARKLLGELQVTQHETAAARGDLELALASLREMGNRREEAEVLELLSRVHLDADEPQKAVALAREALALHRAVRNPVGEVTTLASLARALRELGRHGAVREHLEAALGVLETLHGRLGDPNQRASFLASQREVYELYIDFLMELHRLAPTQGHDLAALEASEQAHSRSLLTLLEKAGAGLGHDVEPALAERRRSFERHFAAKTRRQLQVLSRQHTTAEAVAVEQELYTALTELDNVSAEIRRLSPRHASLRRPQTLDTTAVRALLDDDTVLLEFLLGEERSFLWWVTPSSVTSYELPSRQQIEELAGQVHQQVSAISGRTGATREALDALGEMLLGPIADLLQGQRLVVIADGALHFVPFAALALPRSGQPLLMRHEVVYLPSASVLALQRREFAGRPTPPKTVAILADPIFDRRDPRLAEGGEATGEGAIVPAEARARQAALLEWGDLGRLPHTRREAESIAALVPMDQRLLALDADARRSRVMGDELSDYRILHFATHGFINPRTPELSGLVLSRHDRDGGKLDGFLGLHDVSSLELAAELVVLSGCRTAWGKQVRGEGLVGLTRGFMYAGVPRVVASLWQVRDQATAELMARFYHAMLIEDLAPAAALRAAQLALRRERRFRDPFYWAAFALQGDWR